MTNEMNKKGLSVRDLITTGVLAALYVVCAFIGELMFGFFPVLTFLCPLSIALICGPVFMLILAKVPKHGPILITGVLVGGVLYVTGMYWLMCLAYVILGIVAELVAGSANFKSRIRNLISYMIFVISPIFSYAMLWINQDAYVKYLVENGTGAGIYGYDDCKCSYMGSPCHDCRQFNLFVYQRKIWTALTQKTF